jgi:hypothetical protein
VKRGGVHVQAHRRVRGSAPSAVCPRPHIKRASHSSLEANHRLPHAHSGRVLRYV